MEFDPTVAKQRVRVRDNPALTGLTTGRVRRAGTIEFAEVEFGPNNLQYKPVSGLECVADSEGPAGLFARGSFSTPDDLRRLLTFEKLRGDLTNVFYSMEASNTDFYPHQFKPVLTFIQSTLGRLLIADEVGLGKTIEAILIWLELRAREDARRLLIICPSMLREKWQRDLKSKFNIDGRLVNAQDLLDQLVPVADGGYHHSFALIASLEGLRPPRDYESTQNTSARAKLARLLEANQSMVDRSLIDLVIIDESHYLRNQSTVSNLLGRLVRGAAGNMLLLTATPIQLGSENLYQMLRLLDPDFFSYSTIFDVLLEANKPVVAALRALWSNPPRAAHALEHVRAALATPQFDSDPILRDVETRLKNVSEHIPPDERIALAHMVETRSLLSRYIVRSRKRDVLEKRVVREATSLMVSLNDQERELYETVTRNIRALARDAGEFGIFRLIARQRQLASCMPAAIKAWESQDVLDEYLDEYLWEDLGIAGETAVSAMEAPLADASGSLLPATGGDLYDQLRRSDSKYAEFLKAIQPPVLAGEKVVVFAFYRGTLDYLSKRLTSDGISCIVLKGGMGSDKQDVLEEFQRPDGPRVLLSSEVGSEGIDLQFCRIMVNYDLPWNPMRVEQRIGRIDRLGQQAEKITIINLFLCDTIEDRILQRLYDRIRIFEESIGDLEEILGDVTTEIARRLLDPDLNDEQREERARQSATAIENRRAQQDHLEQQAMNLVGFTDYLLDTIQQSRKRQRWVSAAELIEFVRDFFLHSYPGCVCSVSGDGECSGKLSLSQEARTSMEAYLRRVRPVVDTSLHRGVTAHGITFDPKAVRHSAHHPEVITAKHPLIGWIVEHHEREVSFLYSTAAAILPRHSTALQPGDYVMVVQRWSVRGLRTRTELAYQACALNDGTMVSADESEELAAAVCRDGRPFRNASNRNIDLVLAQEHLEGCNDRMSDRLVSFIEQIQLENQVLCDQEESAARSLAERRIAEFRGRVERFRTSEKNKLIPMTEGLIRREETILDERLQRVSVRRQVDPSWSELVAVLIRVE